MLEVPWEKVRVLHGLNQIPLLGSYSHTDHFKGASRAPDRSSEST